LSLTIPPHLKRVAALPCETSVSENYSKYLKHESLSTTNHKIVYLHVWGVVGYSVIIQ